MCHNIGHSNVHACVNDALAEWAIAHQGFGRIKRGGGGAPNYYLPLNIRLCFKEANSRTANSRSANSKTATL